MSGRRTGQYNPFRINPGDSPEPAEESEEKVPEIAFPLSDEEEEEEEKEYEANLGGRLEEGGLSLEEALELEREEQEREEMSEIDEEEAAAREGEPEEKVQQGLPILRAEDLERKSSYVSPIGIRSPVRSPVGPSPALSSVGSVISPSSIRSPVSPSSLRSPVRSPVEIPVGPSVSSPARGALPARSPPGAPARVAPQSPRRSPSSPFAFPRFPIINPPAGLGAPVQAVGRLRRGSPQGREDIVVIPPPSILPPQPLAQAPLLPRLPPRSVYQASSIRQASPNAFEYYALNMPGREGVLNSSINPGQRASPVPRLPAASAAALSPIQREVLAERKEQKEREEKAVVSPLRSLAPSAALPPLPHIPLSRENRVDRSRLLGVRIEDSARGLPPLSGLRIGEMEGDLPPLPRREAEELTDLPPNYRPINLDFDGDEENQYTLGQYTLGAEAPLRRALPSFFSPAGREISPASASPGIAPLGFELPPLVYQGEEKGAPKHFDSAALIQIAQDLILSPLNEDLAIILDGDRYKLSIWSNESGVLAFALEDRVKNPGQLPKIEHYPLGKDIFTEWLGGELRNVFNVLSISIKGTAENVYKGRFLIIVKASGPKQITVANDLANHTLLNYAQVRRGGTTLAPLSYLPDVFVFSSNLDNFNPLLTYLNTWFEKHFQEAGLKLSPEEWPAYYRNKCRHGLAIEPKVGPSREEFEEEKRNALRARKSNIAQQAREAIQARNKIRAEQGQEAVDRYNTIAREEGAPPLIPEEARVIRGRYPPLTPAEEQALLAEKRLLPLTAEQEAAFLATFTEEELAPEYENEDLPLYQNLETGECWSVKSLLQVWSNAFDRWPIQRPKWPTGTRREFTFLEASAIVLLALDSDVPLPLVLATLLRVSPDRWREWYNSDDTQRTAISLNEGLIFLYTSAATAETIGVWIDKDDKTAELDAELAENMIPYGTDENGNYVAWKPRGLPVEMGFFAEQRLPEEQKRARQEQTEAAYEQFNEQEWWRKRAEPVILLNLLLEGGLDAVDAGRRFEDIRTSFVIQIQSWLQENVFEPLFAQDDLVPAGGFGFFRTATKINKILPSAHAYKLLREIWREFPGIKSYVDDDVKVYMQKADIREGFRSVPEIKEASRQSFVDEEEEELKLGALLPRERSLTLSELAAEEEDQERAQEEAKEFEEKLDQQAIIDQHFDSVVDELNQIFQAEPELSPEEKRNEVKRVLRMYTNEKINRIVDLFRNQQPRPIIEDYILLDDVVQEIIEEREEEGKEEAANEELSFEEALALSEQQEEDDERQREELEEEEERQRRGS